MVDIAYDVAGNPTIVTDPAGDVTNFEYDALNRRSKTIDPELRPTERQYDPAGRLFRVIDALAQISQEYAYSANGRVESLKDAGTNVTNYEYDEFDRLKRTIYPDLSDEVLSYDAAGNILNKRTRALQNIAFLYDTLDRRDTKTLPGEPAIQYTYDLAGRLTEVSDAAGPIQHDFDTAGRLSLVTFPDTKTVGYQYDDAGNRTRVTWPDAYFVTYGYDEMNRPTEVRENGTTLLMSYGYDPLSRRITADYGNGAATTYDYAVDDDLLTLGQQFTATSVDFSYLPNSAGQRTGLGVSDEAYLFRPVAEDNVAYTSNVLNQYDTVGGTIHGYDANGNLTDDGVFTYGYDAENRLVSATQPAPGISATYVFDPLGRRTAKTVNILTTSYLYDGARVIADYDGAGALIQRYVYGPGIDEPIAAVTAAGDRLYHHMDGLGSVVALSDDFGAAVETEAYNAFGVSAVPAGATPYRYTGRRFDAETGLYHYRARAYSPALGRFLQPDPIGYLGGLNLYAYVANDPLNRLDPFGLFKVTAIGGGGASAVGITAGGEASGGVAIGFDINSPTDISVTDVAGFISISNTPVGFNVSADVFIGAIFGDLKNLPGTTANVNIVVGIISVTIFTDPDSESIFDTVTGGTIGIGPGVPGGSVTVSQTEVFPKPTDSVPEPK